MDARACVHTAQVTEARNKNEGPGLMTGITELRCRVGVSSLPPLV